MAHSLSLFLFLLSLSSVVSPFLSLHSLSLFLVQSAPAHPLELIHPFSFRSLDLLVGVEHPQVVIGCHPRTPFPRKLMCNCAKMNDSFIFWQGVPGQRVLPVGDPVQHQPGQEVLLHGAQHHPQGEPPGRRPQPGERLHKKTS